MRAIKLFTVLALISFPQLYSDSSSKDYQGYNDWRSGNLQGGMTSWNAMQNNKNISNEPEDSIAIGSMGGSSPGGIGTSGNAGGSLSSPANTGISGSSSNLPSPSSGPHMGTGIQNNPNSNLNTGRNPPIRPGLTGTKGPGVNYPSNINTNPNSNLRGGR